MSVNKRMHGSNNHGAVLLTVLTVACFAAILLTAVLTFVNRTYTNSFNNYNSEQAYYIASSAVTSINDYLNDDASNYETLLKLAGSATSSGTTGTINFKSADPSKTDQNINDFIAGGDCQISVSYVNTTCIRVSVTGICNGQTETINAYYNVTPATKPQTIDNALYSDATSSFNESAGSTGSVTTRGSITISNDANGEGSTVAGKDLIVRAHYTWTNDPSNQANSFVAIGHNLYIDQQGTSFIPVVSKETNTNVSQFISVGGAFIPNNSTVVGDIPTGTDAPSDKKMDIYCSTMLVAGNSPGIQVNGNVYCYKLDDWTSVHNATCGCTLTVPWIDGSNTINEATHNGSFVLSMTSSNPVDIYGDLYVEGNLVLSGTHRANVNGTLYVTSQTQMIASGTAAIICDAISTDLPFDTIKQWINSNHLKIRKTPGGNQYYTAAELENLSKGSAAQQAEYDEHVKTAVMNKGNGSSRNSKPSTHFDNYMKEYPPTAEFLATHTDILDAYNGATKAITSYTKNQVVDGINFDYVVNSGKSAVTPSDGVWFNDGGMSGDKAAIVLIDLDAINDNFVVKLKSPNPIGNGVVFIVKNTPKASGNNFCYFIADNTAPMTVDAYRLSIMDYDTYKEVVLGGKAINLTSYVDKNTGDRVNDLNTNGGYQINHSGDYGLYTPHIGTNILMLNPGDLLDFGAGNRNSNLKYPNQNFTLFCECLVYAPKARVTAAGGYGTADYYYLKDARNGNNQLEQISSTRGDSRLSVLGAIVCNDFEGHNTFGVGFIPPDPDSGVGSASSATATMVTFSHYESR